VFIDKQPERPGPPCFLPDVVEADNQQLERVLSCLGQKPTELERYVYLIGLCNRNERLFHKVLMSDRIVFLLASDCRRRLQEIWLHLRSFNSDTQFDPSQRPSSAAAA
jgi:hypothetical protein